MGTQTSPGATFSDKDPPSISFTLPLFGLKVDNTIEGTESLFPGEPARDWKLIFC
jgi:hypothetical protein